MRAMSLILSLAAIAILNGFLMSRVAPTIDAGLAWPLSFALGLHGAICAALVYAGYVVGGAVFLIPFCFQSLAALLVLNYFPDGNIPLLRAVLTMGLTGAFCGAVIAFSFCLARPAVPHPGQSYYRD